MTSTLLLGCAFVKQRILHHRYAALLCKVWQYEAKSQAETHSLLQQLQASMFLSKVWTG
jgi:hypothetical protein